MIFKRSLVRTVSISATRANAFVSNSASVDQCQSRRMKPSRFGGGLVTLFPFLLFAINIFPGKSRQRPFVHGFKPSVGVALFTLEFWRSVFYLVSSQNFRAGSVSKATEQTYRCDPPTFCLIGLLVVLNLLVRFPDF